MNILSVEKEMLPLLPLKRVEKQTATDKGILLARLYEAVLRGNTYKSKCTLYVQTTEGVRKVNTTIWYASESHVCLKGGITIPVRCIVDVEV